MSVSDLLKITGLTVELATKEGWVRPVNEVSLRIGAGEALGLVGESGSGKTMLSLALMGLLPAGARVSGEIRGLATETRSAPSGSEEERARKPSPRASGARAMTSLLNGRQNLVELSERQWRGVRGHDVAMIFQEPMTSLNPVMRVGAQIEEAILAHEPRIKRQELRRRVRLAMEQASLPEPELRAEQFPHQLSGGLRQRAMIAMALAPRPRLLIADEPTTALDVTVQKQILDLLDRLQRELRLGLLFITHDLGVVSKVAERVAVMYAGRIVEEGPVRKVLCEPRHPYTQGLLAASPTLERKELKPIPGTVPALTELPKGCAFAARCEYRREQCEAEVPDMRIAGPGHAARCVLV
jgi:oligopeptide/dipeptide ABC transporter ATP-binding protein